MPPDQPLMPAMPVDTSTPQGLSDGADFVQEQASAKGSFPGPVPIVASGATTTRHVAEAKAIGCQGVMVSCSNGDGDQLIRAAVSLALEPIALVATAEEVESALAAGAKILCAAPVGKEVAASDAAAAAGELKRMMPQDVVAMAGVAFKAESVRLRLEPSTSPSNTTSHALKPVLCAQIASPLCNCILLQVLLMRRE